MEKLTEDVLLGGSSDGVDGGRLEGSASSQEQSHHGSEDGSVETHAEYDDREDQGKAWVSV